MEPACKSQCFNKSVRTKSKEEAIEIRNDDKQLKLLLQQASNYKNATQLL